MSFQRLKSKYENSYKGGILVIDTTLYPASQIKLIEALRKFSSQLKLQIIFTMHSLSILEKTCELQADSKITNQVKVLYLQKFDNEVKLVENITFEKIRDKLNIAMALKPVTFKILYVISSYNKCFIKKGAFCFKAIVDGEA